MPGFGAAPQIPVPQHNRRKRCERPEGRKKRGRLQNAACPHAPAHPTPQALRAAQRPQETRYAAKRGMPLTPPPAPHPASIASGPKAARNEACRKARHAPTPQPPARRKRCERPKGRKKRGMLQSAACPSRPSAPHPRKHCERPKGRKKRGKPQRAAFLPQPPRIPPQSLPPPPPLPSIT